MGQFRNAYEVHLRDNLAVIPEVTDEHREAYGKLAELWADYGRPALVGALYPIAAFGAALLAWDDVAYGRHYPDPE